MIKININYNNCNKLNHKKYSNIIQVNRANFLLNLEFILFDCRK